MGLLGFGFGAADFNEETATLAGFRRLSAILPLVGRPTPSEAPQAIGV